MQFRPQSQGTTQVVVREGVLFNTDKVQGAIGRRSALEQRPRAKEAETGAKARFANHQAFSGVKGSETFGQPIGSQKHVGGFGHAGAAGKVHVTILPGLRLAVLVPVEFGMLKTGVERGGHRRFLR